MVKSLPFLANAVVLMLIFFFVFGITGVEMFGGALRRHCVDNETCSLNHTLLINYSGTANTTCVQHSGDRGCE